MSNSTLVYRLWAPTFVGGAVISQGAMRLLAGSYR